MGKIDYASIYNRNKQDWYALTENPQKYEALLAGHYSDSNHFVYELLQNAEDAFETNSDGVFDPQTCTQATSVVIEYYHDRLVFYHNGKPFDECDVRGVSSMLMGTKDKEDAQTIGRFGMGFKSVFKYTYQPEIYSDDEAFMIKSYLLPEEIENGWNYIEEKQSIVCKLGNNRVWHPFAYDKHLTKIVIPFSKYGRNEKLVPVPGDDVLKKLNELNGEILLFLTHINKLYWINKETGRFSYISKERDNENPNIVTCRVIGSDNNGKEEVNRYLCFKKIFNHKEMNNAEVSVAYRLNSRADNINELEDSPVWVYFPTRDDTDLPFLIHGSFETAVSREKLMTPSSFNDDLFDELGTLIADSMVSLAENKLITQMFIRKLLMVAFEDEENNGTIPGLKEKITAIIKKKGLLPDKYGDYRKPSELKLPIPFRLAEFTEKPLFKKAFRCDSFVAINSEKETHFSDYYTWLVEDLRVSLYKLSDVAKDLESLEGTAIMTTDERKALMDFYSFLSENRESIFTTGLSYNRSGPYETAIRQDISLAWKRLRNAPIILNQMGCLVSAYVDKRPSVYLNSSSKYKSIMQSELVNQSVADKYRTLLSEAFKIEEFDNFQFVKEKIVQKYIDIGDNVKFNDDDHYEKEYIEDIKQIIDLINDTGRIDEVQKMLEKAFIIKVTDDSAEEDGEGTFAIPSSCYIPKTSDGIDLNIWYAPVAYPYLDKEDLEDSANWDSFDMNTIDIPFFENNGISISNLSKLGLITTPVDEGAKMDLNGTGDYYWKALGDYCPRMKIDKLDENLEFIEEYPDHTLAQQKSVEMLKLLLKVSYSLIGKVRKRKHNPYDVEEKAPFLDTISDTSWLYDRNMNLLPPCRMSRYDLNQELYGSIVANKKAFETLGFVEKEIDSAEETLQKAQSLSHQDKRRLVNILVKDLGLQLAEATSDDDWGDDESEVFNPNTWVDGAFPVRRINNMDYLTRHVKEQFFCADPVKYEKVWMQIRTSRNPKADQSYAKGMYTNPSNITICQMCKKPAEHPQAKQIANLGIEMPQLNLCLCSGCAPKYDEYSRKNKNEFNERVKKAVLSTDVSFYMDEYPVSINDHITVYFTQIHLAEVQTILNLLSEYGVPSNKQEEITSPIIKDSPKPDATVVKKPGPITIDKKTERRLKGFLNNRTNPTPLEDEVNPSDNTIAKVGSVVTCIVVSTGKRVTGILDPQKYPLHGLIKGHREGDIIKYKGQTYKLASIKNADSATEGEWISLGNGIKQHKGKKYDTYYLHDQMAVHAYHMQNKRLKVVFICEEVKIPQKDVLRYELIKNPNYGKPGEKFNLKGTLFHEQIIFMLRRASL